MNVIIHVGGQHEVTLRNTTIIQDMSSNDLLELFVNDWMAVFGLHWDSWDQASRNQELFTPKRKPTIFIWIDWWVNMFLLFLIRFLLETISRVAERWLTPQNAGLSHDKNILWLTVSHGKIWLMVLNILKNMSQWEEWHPIYEMKNEIDVWNHQPENPFRFKTIHQVSKRSLTKICSIACRVLESILKCSVWYKNITPGPNEQMNRRIDPYIISAWFDNGFQPGRFTLLTIMHTLRRFRDR